MSKSILTGLLVMMCSAVLSAMPPSEAQQKTEARISASKKNSLRKFLQSLDHDKTAHYIAAFQDLDGDGQPEAIVYLLSNDWCGSGGCSLFILAQQNGSWRTVTNIRITRPPIRVAAKTSHGWHNITVWVQGGGIEPGYEAELQFSGKTYPTNPTVAPAHRFRKNQAAELIMRSTDKAQPLH